MHQALIVVLVMFAVACSKQEGDKPATTESSKPSEGEAKPAPAKPDPSPARAPSAANAPTKDAAIARLRELQTALDAKDYDKASTMFLFPSANIPKDKIAKELAKLVDTLEISSKGIDVLAAKGTFGKLAEVFEPNRAASMAARYKVSVDDCYGFLFKDGTKTTADAGFHWNGKELRLIRLNNVGKLGP